MERLSARRPRITSPEAEERCATRIGRRCRVLTVLDVFGRECLALCLSVAGSSMNGITLPETRGLRYVDLRVEHPR
jgi:hypothetical protein